MSGWPEIALRDLGDWYGGGTPSKANPSFWENGHIPWLSPKDMGRDVIGDTRDHISDGAVSASAVKLVPPGSVAIVVRSGILERTLPVAVVPFETTLNQDMKAVAPREDVDPRWIAWGIRAFEAEILGATRKRGTTVASLEMPRLLEWRIPLPPLEDQREVLDLLEDHLSRLDAASSYLRSALARAQAVERSTLSRCREGGWRQLSEVAAIQGGIQKQQKRAPRDHAFPFLRVANVTASGLDLTEVHTVELFDGELERLRLSAGDLLVVEGNGSASQIGRAALWDGSIDDCVHQNHLIRVRPLEGGLPEYLEAVWNSPQNRSMLSDVSSSRSGLHTLSVSKLKSLSVPVPSIDRQRVLVAKVVGARRARSDLEREVRAAQKRAGWLRRAILMAAFSGRLTSSTAHDDLEIA